MAHRVDTSTVIGASACHAGTAPLSEHLSLTHAASQFIYFTRDLVAFLYKPNACISTLVLVALSKDMVTIRTCQQAVPPFMLGTVLKYLLKKL